MSEQIRALSAQFVENIFNGNGDGATDFVTSGFSWAGPSLLGAQGGGLKELREFSTKLRGALPNLRASVERPIVEDERAVVRWTIRGQHTGTALGAPTKLEVLFTGIHMLRCVEENGPPRVSSLHQQWGQMGLLQNLGLIPFIGGPGTELPGATIEREERFKLKAERACGVAEDPCLQNKELVAHIFESVIGRSDLAPIDRWVAEKIHDHNPGPSDLAGREGIKQVCNLLHKAFPDLHGTIDEMIAEDDRVVVRWTVHGTNSCGCGGIDATRRNMTGTGIDILRIVGEGNERQIVDRWGNSDDTGILIQLGLIQLEPR